MDAAKYMTIAVLVGVPVGVLVGMLVDMLERGLWMLALTVRDVKRDSEVK